MTARGISEVIEVASKPEPSALDDAFEQRLARARLPFVRTIETFDFAVQPTLRRESLAAQLGPSFVAEGQSLILSGKSGRGKTHLAIAIAHRALVQGHDVKFVSAASLIDTVTSDIARGRGRASLLRYLRTSLLVLDDIGYALHNPSVATILFQIVSERHRRGRAMILTASKPPEQWGELIGNQDAADAILDRLLERGVHCALGGPSMRTPYRGASEAPENGAHRVLRLAVQPAAEPSATEDGEALCKRYARELVGRLGLKEAIYHLRGTMNDEALERSRGSRRAAANLLGVDRRYVQRLADEYAQGGAPADDLP